MQRKRLFWAEYLLVPFILDNPPSLILDALLPECIEYNLTGHDYKLNLCACGALLEAGDIEDGRGGVELLEAAKGTLAAHGDSQIKQERGVVVQVHATAITLTLSSDQLSLRSAIRAN